jgi:predicted RNase H-like nuclease
MQARFTGFDSAWGTRNKGAICDLLSENYSLKLEADPAIASWDDAVVRAHQPVGADLHVWAVDQPLVVANQDSCRPVDRQLASALMGDFQCGAHSANLALPPWRAGAPIWSFLGALEHAGYRQEPFAIPSAARGRFYFECYPHPALLGLFDLDRLVRYKVHHKDSQAWHALVQLLRSLVDAELPVTNIGSFVREDLPQTKQNEDRLDALIAAYVAAYWAKFGLSRSTLLGDLSTGYIVTPHSERMRAAFARVPEGRQAAAKNSVTKNPPQRLSAGLHEELPSIPRCDWVYFATPAKWSGTVTATFVAEQKVIVRTLHNSKLQSIANVRHLKPGETILLTYGGHGTSYHPLFAAEITAPGVTVENTIHDFPAFRYIDEQWDESLRAGGYTPDPVLNRFTGISIQPSSDLRHIQTSGIARPPGKNTLCRWTDVFRVPSA